MSINLKLNNIEEKDRGVLSPCGVLCLGCDSYVGEALEAAQKLQAIWDGWNILDIGSLLGLNPKGIQTTLKTLKLFIKVNKNGNCPGCFKGAKASSICGISNCVRNKGYWTCAECDDYNPDSETPCPHINQKQNFITDKGQMMKLMCHRYNEDLNNNLKRCREIGYEQFIKEAKEKVSNGWRTWQIINKDMVFTNALKRR